jgi:hypothetical protein
MYQELSTKEQAIHEREDFFSLNSREQTLREEEEFAAASIEGDE